ncbi:MAG: porin [Dissulfuribacterales bacterium]
MLKKSLFLLTLLMLLPSLAGAIEVYRNGDVSLNIGYWAQAWYQYVGDIDRDGDGKWDDSLNDFMVRRTYFSVSGTVTPKVSVFMHYAGDRIGQEGLDKSGMGLGTGLALRDCWVNYKLLGNDLMVQVGRMYVPFTRNYGTTSTKSLLTTELDWGQGGLRSGILYPQKVGRDDSVTLWGNVVKDKLQYRLMVGEGVEDSTVNPDDKLRFAGRLSFNLFDPETSWFNAGTYLGKKKILAIGGGFDFQPDLIMGGEKRNYEAYTADVHLDLPLESCAVTAEVAWITLRNVVNTVTWSDLTAGTDGDIYTAKAGILLAGNIQPFAHYELINPDVSGADDTTVYGIGCNYYIKGPANKLTLEYSKVDDDNDISVDIITVQAAFGF